MNTKGILACFVFVFLLAGFTTEALSQQYPANPITMVVGVSPGGIIDVTTRVLTEEAKKFLGQEVLVVNKIGTTHVTGMSYVISSKPDGYTLGCSTDMPYVRGPYVLKLNFDPLTDTLPIILFAGFRDAFIVSAESPFKTFKEVVDFARENPGKLTFAHTGISTLPYLTIAGVTLQRKLNITSVPFTGEGLIFTNLIGGHVMMGGVGFTAAVPHVKAGKIRILALNGDERVETFPQVPTLKELGMDQPLPTAGCVIYGPKDLPDSVAKIIEDTIIKVCESAAFKKYALDNDLYLTKGGITGKELRNYLSAAHKNTGDLMYELGIIKTKPQ